MKQSARTFVASKAPNGSPHTYGSRGGVVWRLVLLVLVLGLAAGFVVARYLVYDQITARYDQVKAQLHSATVQANADIRRLQAALDIAQGQLTVEQSTRKALEASLATSQKALGQAHDQLAFFHQLFPPGPRGSVNIRALDVSLQGHTLVYKVLLSRNASDDSLFKGTLQFESQGRLDGKRVKITLEPEQIDPGSGPQDVASQLALSFDQFQRREGVLALPDGFEPDVVTLSVLQGDTVRVSRTVNMS